MFKLSLGTGAQVWKSISSINRPSPCQCDRIKPIQRYFPWTSDWSCWGNKNWK